MKKNIFIIVILIIISIVGSLYLYISAKINPEEIRLAVVSAIQDNYPNLAVEIEKIDYEISLNVKLQVKDLKLSDKVTKKTLAELPSFNITIPVWSILTSGGTVEIKIISPLVFVHQDNKGDFNFQSSFQKKEITSKNKKVNTKKIEIPQFLHKSRVNVRIEKAIVDYQLNNQESGRVIVNQVLLKNINLKTTTAFEIDLALKISLKNSQNIKSKLQFVGEVDLGKYLIDGETVFNLMCSLKDNTVDDLGVKIPDIDILTKVESVERTNYKISSVIKFEEVSDLELDVLINQSEIVAQKIKSITNLSKIVKILPKEVRSELSALSVGKANLVVDGNLSYNLKTQKVYHNLSIATNSTMSYRFNEEEINFKINADYIDENLNLKVSSEILDANIVTEIATILAIDNLPNDMQTLKPFDIKVNVTNLKLTKSYIQQKLYIKNQVEKDADNDTATVVQEVSKEKVHLPQATVKFTGKEIYVGDEEITFDIDLGLKNNELKTNHFILNWGKGKVSLESFVNFTNMDRYNGTFNTKLSKINFISFAALFPPYLKSIEGEFSGNATGKFSVAETKKYDIRANFNAKDGQIEELDLREHIMPIIDNVQLLKGKINKNDLIRSGGFSSLSFDGNITEKKLIIKKINLTGQRGTADIKANGYVGMSALDSSEVYVVLVDKSEKLSKLLISEIGENELPLLLKGKGFILIPDQNYTANKLLSKKIAIEKKKIGEKVNKKIQNEKQKVEKVKKEIESKVKDQADKLMKGILKK
jgi:hypothetical protein